MQKIRKILEFILALLNFLFHFKPVPDEKPPVNTQTYPDPDLQERNLYLKLSVRIRLW